MTSTLSVLISKRMQDLLHYLPITAAVSTQEVLSGEVLAGKYWNKTRLLLLLLWAWPTGELWTQRAWPRGLLSLTWQQTSTYWKDWKRNVTAVPPTRPTSQGSHGEPVHESGTEGHRAPAADDPPQHRWGLVVHLRNVSRFRRKTRKRNHFFRVGVAEEPDHVELVRPATCQIGKFNVKVLRLMLDFYFSEHKYSNL